VQVALEDVTKRCESAGFPGGDVCEGGAAGSKANERLAEPYSIELQSPIIVELAFTQAIASPSSGGV
jgi:hypothetical protein